MDRSFLMLIVVLFMALLLGLMALGWRARRRRQSAIAAPLSAPVSVGDQHGSFSGKYVATTASGDPLDRIAVHQLGFRGAATLSVSTEGLLLQRPGSNDIWIPKTDLRDRRRATWTIDRVVEPGGLDLVEWSLGDKTVDSYFRMDDPAAFENALDGLLERKAS